MSSFFKKIVFRIKSRVPSGSFNRNVLIILLGTILGQMASVILSPVLTRIYSPSEFGALGSFSSLITIMIVVASLRYEMALPLTQTKNESLNLLAVCFLVLLFTTALILLLLLLLPFLHTGVEDIFSVIWPYRFLLPVGFFALGAYQILINYATREAEYTTISKTKVYQGATGPVTQIALGLWGAGVWGMIIGFVVGQSAGVGLLISKLFSKPCELIKGISIQGMLGIAKRYIRFPLISSWSGLISAAGSNALLIAVLPFMFSSSIAGFVFLTDRVIGRPLLMLTTSILQVYMGDVSKSLMTDRSLIRQRFIGLAKQQTVIVSLWLALVNIAAPFLFSKIFGEAWNDAVPYLQVLSIAYLFQMILHSFAHTLQLLERQVLSCVWELARLILVTSAFIAGAYFDLKPIDTLLLYSLCQAFAHVVLFILMYYSIAKIAVSPLPGTENAADDLIR